MTVELSSCRRCGQRKPVTEFWANLRVSTGLSPWCKDCQREATRRSKAIHGERYNAARRKPKQARVCPCGESFETAIPHQRFCSFNCKNAEANRRYRERRKVRKGTHERPTTALQNH